MAKTFITVTGSGESTVLADSGLVSLRFVFPNLPDVDTAFAETAGFVDALLADEPTPEAGFLAVPVAHPVIVTGQENGLVQASFVLDVEFHDGCLVHDWLEASGLIDADHVSVLVGPVVWELSDELLEAAQTDARFGAVVDANEKASDYRAAIGGRSSKLAHLAEVGVLVELLGSARLEDGMSVELGDCLDEPDTFTVTVDVVAGYSVKSA